jgi:hypothetical protein
MLEVSGPKYPRDMSSKVKFLWKDSLQSADSQNHIQLFSCMAELRREQDAVPPLSHRQTLIAELELVEENIKDEFLGFWAMDMKSTL